MYYVYLLESEDIDRVWYTGFTHDLKERLKQHNSKSGGKTTKVRDGWKLIYYEAYLNKQDAIGRELFLKSGSGKKFLKKQLLHYIDEE